MDRTDEALAAQSLPAPITGYAHVGEVLEASLEEVLGDSGRDEVLVGKVAGKIWGREQVPKANHRDAAVARRTAKFEIETTGEDPIATPARKPRRIGVILAALGEVDRPWSVQASVAADTEEE